MLKILYLMSVSSVVVSSITLFQSVAIAQEYPDCFIINSAGKVNSLHRLCKRGESHKLRIVMKAHELYQQGFERGRRGLYKEAFEDFTQAINLNPDFAEAYIARADARTLIEDKQGAVADFQKAIDIYKARGKSEIANMLLTPLQALQTEIQMDEHP